jgi:hypothetical protein
MTTRPIPDQHYDSDAELSAPPVRYGEAVKACIRTAVH